MGINICPFCGWRIHDIKPGAYSEHLSASHMDATGNWHPEILNQTKDMLSEVQAAFDQVLFDQYREDLIEFEAYRQKLLNSG